MQINNQSAVKREHCSRQRQQKTLLVEFWAGSKRVNINFMQFSGFKLHKHVLALINPLSTNWYATSFWDDIHTHCMYMTKQCFVTYL